MNSQSTPGRRKVLTKQNSLRRCDARHTFSVSSFTPRLSFSQSVGRSGAMQRRAAPASRPRSLEIGLLGFVRLYHFLDLGLEGIQVERGWVLHRRIVDGCHCKLTHSLLHEDKSPELARHEVIHVSRRASVECFAADVRQALEGILPDVYHRRHISFQFLSWPAIGLLDELELEVIDAERTEFGAGEVEELMTSGRSCTRQDGKLVVAVQVVLVGAVAELHALEELVGDIGITGSGHKRREPIEPGEDSVLNRAGLDVSGPADNGRHTESTIIGRTLTAFERSHTTVRPGVDFGTIVGGEYNDGVVGFADVFKVFEKLTNAVVHLGHTRFF